MKKIYIALLLLISVFAFCEENNLNKAINEYKNNNYEKAIELLNELDEQGYKQPSLYYNLGNSYWRLNKPGKAILNFKKALKLKPNYAPAAKNLKYALRNIEDKIKPEKQNWLSQKLKVVYNAISLNVSSVILFVSFIALFACIALVLTTFKNKSKNWIGLIIVKLVFVNVFSVWLTFEKHNDLYKVTEGVIISKTVDAFSGPSNTYKQLFTVHEGTYFEIVQISGKWAQVKLNGGLGGWILTETFEEVKIFE